MTHWRPVAMGALALGLAFGAGLYLARPAEPAGGPAPPPAIAERVVVERPGLPAARGPSLDEIRAAVREEMAQRAGDEPAAAPPARTEEAVKAAIGKANTAVAEGIRRGVWSEHDRGELRAQLVQLGPAEIHEVLSPLFQAINAQQLHLDGPPI